MQVKYVLSKADSKLSTSSLEYCQASAVLVIPLSGDCVQSG